MLTPSVGGIRYFTFNQSTPSTTWTIYHGFGQEPLVDVNVLDSGEYKKAFPLSIVHNDVNNITITWTTARAGKAMLAATVI
jgi:hypothetical protein